MNGTQQTDEPSPSASSPDSPPAASPVLSTPPPASHPSRNRTKWIAASVIALLAVALAVGIPIYLHHRHTHVSTDDAFVDGYIHYVTSRIPGKIVDILVDDNQTVEAGQVLVELDRDDLEAEVRIARARLAVARNQVAAQLQSAGAARASVAALKAQARYAAKQRERATRLVRADAAPQVQYDETSMRWESIADQTAAARRQRREILAGLGPPGPHGEQAEVELALATLAKAELELGYTTIRAPVRGLVTRKQVQAGQVITPAQPLFAVVPLDDIYITANYKETDLTHVRVGQPVKIAVDTYPSARFEGRVDSIMSGTGAAFSLIPPENATGNYVKVVQRIPVKIALRHHDGEPVLRLGMSVEPTILVPLP